MSRRRILNISSKKKRNTILPFNFNYQGVAEGPGAKDMGSDRITTLLTRPTALYYDEDAAYDHGRNSRTVYWRGIKEVIDVNVLGGTSWRWRRIVFEAKGLESAQSALASLVSNVETSVGFPRAMIELSGDPPANIRNALEAVLFTGRGEVDWLSAFNARVDTNRVRLISDEFHVLRSGNDRGHFHQFKRWYPLNKNMHYSDDENGKDQTLSSHAAPGRSGMGDVFILDYFQAMEFASNFRIQFAPTSTLYWHEK